MEDLTLIKIDGDLDAAAAQATRDRLFEAWRDCKLGIVLDLSDVGFMDSAGVGVVVALSRQLQRSGKTLQILAGEGQPRRILTMVGVS